MKKLLIMLTICMILVVGCVKNVEEVVDVEEPDAVEAEPEEIVVEVEPVEAQPEEVVEELVEIEEVEELPEFIEFNGILFEENVNGKWEFDLYDFENDLDMHIVFLNNPVEVQDVPVNGDVGRFLDDAYEVITERGNAASILLFNPDEKLQADPAYKELKDALWDVTGVESFTAVTKASSEFDGIPVKKCTDQEPTVEIKSGPQAKVTYSSTTCVTIEGSGVELGRAVDKFLYTIFGIY